MALWQASTQHAGCHGTVRISRGEATPAEVLAAFGRSSGVTNLGVQIRQCLLSCTPVAEAPTSFREAEARLGAKRSELHHNQSMPSGGLEAFQTLAHNGRSSNTTGACPRAGSKRSRRRYPCAAFNRNTTSNSSNT